MVVVLPEPLTPMTRMTKGRLLLSISSGWASGVEHGLDFRRENVLHFVGADAFVIAAFGDRVGDPQRCRRAEIGADQHILKLFQRAGIEFALVEYVVDFRRRSPATSAINLRAGASTRRALAAAPERAARGRALMRSQAPWVRLQALPLTLRGR